MSRCDACPQSESELMNPSKQCRLTSPVGAALLTLFLWCAASAAHMAILGEGVMVGLAPLRQPPRAATIQVPNIATGEQDISDRANLDTKITDVNSKIDKLSKAEVKTEYDTLFAKLCKELTDLHDAVTAPMAGAMSDLENYGILAIKSNIKMIWQAVFMADAMGPEHQCTPDALLQQEPEVPMQDSHSDKIVTKISEFKVKIPEVKIDDPKKGASCRRTSMRRPMQFNEAPYGCQRAEASWNLLPKAGKDLQLLMMMKDE